MSNRLQLILLLALVMSPAGAVCADDPPAKKIDPEAAKVMRAAAEYLQGLQSFSTDMKSALHVDTPSGPTDMTASYSIAVQKPNLIAITLNDGAVGKDSMGATVVSDGKELSIYVPRVQKYSVEDAPKTLHDFAHGTGMMAHMIHGVSFSGLFLLLEPEDEMAEAIQSSSYLGEKKLGERAVHHLKISTETTDYQFWIDVGERPLVEKIVPDIAKALERSGNQLPEGVKFAMSATFSNWKSDPQLAAKTFRFTAPEGAEKVESLFGGGKPKPHPLLGKEAPDFELETLKGKPFKLADYRDKDVVILDFWATWCGPCVQALPTIAEVAAAYKSKGVTFYAVNLAEDKDTVADFLKDKKLDVPVLLDTEGKVGGLYQAEAIPQTVLVGKDGVIEVVHVGLSQDLKKRLTKELDALLAGKKLAEEELKRGEASGKEKASEEKAGDAKSDDAKSDVK